MLEPSVDVHGEIRAVSHQIRVADMMFDDSSTQDNLAALIRQQSQLVDATNIAGDIDNQFGLSLASVEVNHVANGTIGKTRTEHGNIVLGKGDQRRQQQ
jgi:hypothetical protein